MVQFETGEQIIKIIRRHYLVLVPLMATLMIFALLPLVVYALLISNFFNLDQAVINSIQNFFSEWKTFGYSIWLLILWTIFFVEWTDYYLDIWIVTDRRIIDVEQNGFFRREITSFNHEQIQDITVEINGLMQTFFKFGALQIQTAGHGRDIIIRDAHYPEDARSLILKLQLQSKSKQSL